MTSMTRDVHSAHLKRQILKAASQVRKKFKAIKSGQRDDTATFQKIFQPVTEKLSGISETLTTQHQPIVKEEIDESETKLIPRPLSSIHTQKSVNTPKKAQPEEEEENDESHDGTFFDVDDTLNGSTSSAAAQNSYDEMPEAGEQFLSQYADITKQYLKGYMSDVTGQFDTTYGLRYDATLNKWMLGRSIVKFDEHGNVFVEDTPFTGTEGLYQLLFLNRPKLDLISKQDEENYRKILNLSSVYRRKFDDRKQVRGSTSHKYQTFIKPNIIPTNHGKRSSKGGGIHQPSDNNVLITNNKPIEYIYWNDINELVDRLRLLIASTTAGNKNHNNEIVSIVEELREASVIV